MRYDMNTANTFNLYVARELKSSETTAMLGWQHKFGANTTGSLNVQAAPTFAAVGSLQGNSRIRDLPVQWSVSSDGENHYGNARVTLPKADIDLAISNHDARVSVEGGVWIGEGGVIPTRRPYASYVVAEVPKTVGVVLNGSGAQVTTNKTGYAVLANVPALMKQPMSVDTKSLPVETELEIQLADAVAPRGGGTKVVFPIKSETMRTYQVFTGGTFTPEAKAKSDSEETVVGEEGYLVLMDPKEGQTIHVTSDGFTCSITLPALSKTALDVTRVECVEVKP